MTDYTVVSRFRNKDQVNFLVQKLIEKGKTCYNFTEEAADPNNPDAHPEEQMKVFEAKTDFVNDPYFRHLFERDLAGIKNADQVIMLLPSGNSAHVEIGIAYGLGKKCILVGEPEKAESLYLLFHERYPSIEDFLATI